MRMAVFVTFAAIGICLIGTTQMTAAPASGNVIREAANANSPVTKVPCGNRRVCDRRGCVTRWVCW